MASGWGEFLVNFENCVNPDAELSKTNRDSPSSLIGRGRCEDSSFSGVFLLFLVHHGDAVGPGIEPSRPLSPEGREAVKRLAEGAAARGTKPAVIWHSGKLRAKQTAEAFWRTCNPFAEFSATKDLPSCIAEKGTVRSAPSGTTTRVRGARATSRASSGFRSEA
jgi:hypothetical protein